MTQQDNDERNVKKELMEEMCSAWWRMR